MEVTLTRSEKLSRMYNCDSSADGLFITGVITTGIYCLPSCTARKPKEENVRFFDREVDAQAAGLRACKRCRPDQYYAGVDLDWKNLASVLEVLHEDPSLVKTISELAEQAKIGQTKLYRVVEQYWSTTPGELIHAVRIKRAKELLMSPELGITGVAYEVGYESLSTFYTRFKQVTGVTPRTFRKHKATVPRKIKHKNRMI